MFEHLPPALAGRVVDHDTAMAAAVRASDRVWAPPSPSGSSPACGSTSATGAPRADVFVCTVTPPGSDGTVSLGLSNGADGDVLARLLVRHDMALLCYVQPRMPWIDGFDFAPNTFDLHRLAPLARDDRLWLVADDGPAAGHAPRHPAFRDDLAREAWEALRIRI